MKWWLDALRARHIEFSEPALREIFDKISSDKVIYNVPKGFTELINKKSAEWDRRVKKWVKEPLTIFHPIYYWNSPQMAKMRREARAQRESRYKDIMDVIPEILQRDLYHGTDILDPLGKDEEGTGVGI